eukprot:jgi/Tetstr1/437889/TSEL_002842.t1
MPETEVLAAWGTKSNDPARPAAKAGKSKDYELNAFGAKIRDRLASFDLDGDGDVDVNEVAAAIESLIKTESSLKQTRTVAYVLAVVVLVIVLANFGLAFAVAALSKDVEFRGSVMLSKDTGMPVEVASADLKVEGGMLIARETDADSEGATRRRLSDDGGQTEPLATATHLYEFTGNPADLFLADDAALTTLQYLEMEKEGQILSLKYKSHDRYHIDFYPYDTEFIEVMESLANLTGTDGLPDSMRISAINIWTFHPVWELITLTQVTFMYNSTEIGVGAVWVDVVHTSEVDEWAPPSEDAGTGQRRRLQACCGINKLKNKIKDLQKVKDQLNDKIDDLQDEVSDLKDDLSDALDDLADAKDWVVNKATSITSILNNVATKLENILGDAKIAETKAEVKALLKGEILGALAASGDVLAELMNDAIAEAADFDCPICIPFQTLMDEAGTADIKLDYSAMTPLDGLSIKLEPTACVEITELEVSADGLASLATKIAARLEQLVDDVLEELWEPVQALLDGVQETAADVLGQLDNAQDTVDDLDNGFRRRHLLAAADQALARTLSEVRHATRDATFRRLRGIEDHGAPQSKVAALVHRLHDAVYPHVYMGYEKHGEAVMKEHIAHLRESAAKRAAANGPTAETAYRRRLQGSLADTIEGMSDVFDDISSTSSPIQLSKFKFAVSFEFRMKMQFTAASSVDLELDLLQDIPKDQLSQDVMLKTPIPGVMLHLGFKVEPALMLRYKAEAAVHSELVVEWENTGVTVDAIAGTVAQSIGGFGDNTGTTVTGYGKGGGVMFQKLKLYVTTGLCLGDACLDAVHYADEVVNVGFDWGACGGAGCAAISPVGSEDVWPMYHNSRVAAGGPRGSASGPSAPVEYSSSSGPGSCFPASDVTEEAVDAARDATSTALTALGLDDSDDSVRDAVLCMTGTQPPSGATGDDGVVYVGAGAWAWVSSPSASAVLKLIMPAGICSSLATDSSLISWDYPVPVPDDGTLFYANMFQTCTEFDVASWVSRALSDL